MDAIKCGFCRLGTEVESICGKLHYDNKGTAAHQKCMEYSAELVAYEIDDFGGFKIEEVEKEIRRGKKLTCSICSKDKSRRGKWSGATAGCELRRCPKSFHYYCAELDDLVLTNRIEYRVFCSEEHFKELKEMKNDSNIMEEDHQNEAPTNFSNTQLEKDTICISDSSSDLSDGECTALEKRSFGQKAVNTTQTVEVRKSAGLSLKQRLRHGTKITTGSHARGLSSIAKPIIQEEEEEKEEEEDDDDDDDDSYDEIDCQSLNDSSESELENTFSRQQGYTSFKKADRKTVNRAKNKNRSFRSDESRNCTAKKKEKPNINKRQNTSKETVSRNGSRISIVSKKSNSKSKDHGDDEIRYITAEVHDATSSFPVNKKSADDEATRNGQGYSSGHDISMETNGFCSGTPDRNNIAEMSSGSESERIQFPVCAVAIPSTANVFPSKEKMMIEKAKEVFDVDNVAIWNTTDCFSDQLTDGSLPHLMNLITDMVSEKNFRQLQSLLTDKSCQNRHMEYYKHMADLPDGMTESIRKSLMKQLDRKEINEKEVIFIDNKLKTLFLKLNNVVDETCTIRNILLPHVKEISGHLFEWKENTVSSAFLSQSDAEMEWKLINAWMTHEKWNQTESSVIPSDNIFLEAKKNQGIEELIKHQSPREENTRKVIFVRALNETVNCNMFIQRLILSCAEPKETLIVCHSAPTTTLQTLIPENLQKETEVQVMSAFKPSNKRGISIIVIQVCNQQQQKKNTGHSQICSPVCGDEGNDRLEEIRPLLNWKRRATVDRTHPKKQKRAA